MHRIPKPAVAEDTDFPERATSRRVLDYKARQEALKTIQQEQQQYGEQYPMRLGLGSDGQRRSPIKQPGVQDFEMNDEQRAIAHEKLVRR